MTLSAEEFRLFRDLIYGESGIFLKDNRRDFLENRLSKRMEATGKTSPYRYYRLVSGQDRRELLIFLDLLTVNETCFFRNMPQLDLFSNTVLPGLLREKDTAGRSIRIWSAGCATGEEPYSLAMLVLDQVRDPAKWDLRIIASDLSLTALETAQRAEYPADRVLDTVDARRIAAYFDKTGDSFRVRDDLKNMVSFDFHNLKNDNGLRDLDVIFCRNVMIYFDEDERRRLLGKFFDSLLPGGHLFIGHAESLHGMNTGFEFIHIDGGTAYRRPGQGQTSRQRTAAALMSAGNSKI
ncbi:MAG: protein-glutamate O-methyltransferase CheR [Nitrospirae bacterium]|nr:protein-glutamate O-methyltransferase CheR [Nitrospirota bacterium]